MQLLLAALALVLSLAAGLGAASAQPQPVRILVNEALVSVPAPAQFQQGILIAPIAPVVQAFGASAAWDPATGTLVVTGAAGPTVRLVAGQATATSGDESWVLPATPTMRDGALVGPVAAVLRRLGAYVHEDPAARTLAAVSQITAVTWRAEASTVVVSVTATGPVHAVDRVLHNPERLVVDFESAVIHLSDPDRTIGSGPVIGIRAAQFQVHPYVTRLVFDLAQPMPDRVTMGPGIVTVVLGASVTAAAGPSSGSIASAQATSPSARPQAAASTQAPVRDSRPPVPTIAWTAPPPAPPVGDSRPPTATTAWTPPPPVPPLRDSRPPASTLAWTAPSPAPRTPGAGGGPPSARADLKQGPVANVAPDASGSGAPPVATPPSAGAPEPLALPPLPEFTDRPGAFHVSDVTYDENAGRLVVHASQRFAYTVAQFVYPDRLAIDISGGVFLDRRRDVEVDNTSIRNIVVSQFNLRPNVTRILVHLNRKVAYAAAAADRGRTLAVTFGSTSARVSAVPTPAGVPMSKGPTVVIDPGHGGEDSGAVGPSGLHEADVTLSIGKMTRASLEQRGIHTVLTRTDDSSVALEDRPDLAQRNGGTLFVSIHANASVSRSAQGTTTYYSSPQSQALAAAVQTEVARALGEPDRGVQTERFYVIVNTPMPAVLIETAFISNPKEEAMLRDPAVQQRIADAIARGIASYLAEQAQVSSH